MGTWALFFDRRFLFAFFTQFFGAFNDNLFKNALVILVTYQSARVFGLGPEQIVALSGAIFILPFFLFSATAGQIADKVDKSRLMVAVKLCEVAIMGLATWGFLTHHFELLLAALFLMGVHSAFFGPVKYSYLPQVYPTAGDLLTANAFFQMGTFLAILLGTILGGVLIAIKPSGELIVSVGVCAVAVFGLLFSLKVPRLSAQNPKLAIEWNPFPPTVRVFRETRKHRSLFLAILGISWFWFFGAAMLSLFPSFGKNVLGANEHVTTLFLALFSVGIAGGSALAKWLSGEVLELGLVPLGSFGLSFFAFFLWLASPSSSIPMNSDQLRGISEVLASSSGVCIGLSLFGLSLSGGLFIVPLLTFIQERGDPKQISRIIATNNILNALAMVIAAVLLMLLFALGLKVPQIFLLLSALNLFVACFIYRLMPEFLLRFLAWVLAKLIYRTRTSGLENIPKTGGCLLACNHVTYIDWFIIGAYCRRPVRFVMDHTFLRIYFVGWLFRDAKVIPIAQAKENPEILAEAFESISRELEAGQVVCIFPEGRLTRDGNLSIFRGGIMRTLERNPVPVVPMALQGLWTSFFSRNTQVNRWLAWTRWREPVTLRVGAPIPPKDVTPEKLQVLVEELLRN